MNCTLVETVRKRADEITTMVLIESFFGIRVILNTIVFQKLICMAKLFSNVAFSENKMIVNHFVLADLFMGRVEKQPFSLYNLYVFYA